LLKSNKKLDENEEDTDSYIERTRRRSQDVASYVGQENFPAIKKKEKERHILT